MSTAALFIRNLRLPAEKEEHMHPDEMNPLVPTTGEAAMLAAGLLAVFLCVVALVSLMKDRHYSPSRRFVWLLIVLAVPVVGSVLWLATASRQLPARRPSTRRPSTRRPPTREPSARRASGRRGRDGTA